MYAEHFGLNEKPFSISPDPRYLYMSQRHADALAHLVYGISESGGFIQLTGEVGTGKTTLIRSLLGQLPDKTEIALILNPQLSTKQFLQAICDELRVLFVQRDTAKTLIDKLNARLLALHAEDCRVVLIVDEAQTMSPVLLEQVRLLTNLETDKQKLLQIILIGQPELREVLARPEMRQIAQRITGRYHLEPLDAPDTASYVAHRMKVAGGRPEVFSKRAMRKLYRLSRGLPRLINIIADRSLLAAYARDEHVIGGGLVGKAADEVFGRSRAARWWPWAAAMSGISILLFGSLTWTETETETVLELAVAEIPPAAIPAAATVAAPDPERSPAASASLSALLTSNVVTSAAAARSALFGQWGLDPVGNEREACAGARASGLQCLKLDNPSLGEVSELGRPAALELVSEEGSSRHLLLLGLSRTDAVVWIDGAVSRLPVEQLAGANLASALMLFRPAVATNDEPLAAGARGPSVIWLRTSLEGLAGRKIATTEPDLFDAALSAAVQDFERARDLPADGIVDHRTLMRLQSEIGLVEIRLQLGSD
jgi:general secretion pathway protein A